MASSSERVHGHSLAGRETTCCIMHLVSLGEVHLSCLVVSCSVGEVTRRANNLAPLEETTESRHVSSAQQA